MEPKSNQLLRVIEEAVMLMRSVGEDHWADWLEKDAKWIRADDSYGIQHFFSAFGGMGSISDLVIHPLNKHRVTESAISSVNERLQDLLGRAYELAQDVRREEKHS